MDAIRAFLSRKRALFSIFEKGWGGLPSGMAVYALISLNMSKYPWKCLNKLFWLCQAPEYAWSSYIFNRLLKFSQFLKKPGFWILNISQCPSVCLNLGEYCWISLNMPENAWKKTSDYARVLNMLQYGYNNIIVTNVIMLEFLSARFIHQGTLLPFYLF